MVAPSEVAFYHKAFVDHVSESPPHHQSLSASLTKLSKFSLKHLLELSTDIYDELVRRRELNGSELRGHLPERPDIHPRRNYARRQIGGLTAGRLSDMCKDLIAEHERRFPDLAEAEADAGADVPSAALEKSFDSDASNPKNGVDLDTEPEMKEISSNEDEPTELKIQSVAATELVPNRSEMIESEDEDDDEDEDENENGTEEKKEQQRGGLDDNEEEMLQPPVKRHVRTASKADTITQVHQNYLPASDDSFDNDQESPGALKSQGITTPAQVDDDNFEFSEDFTSPSKLESWKQNSAGGRYGNDKDRTIGGQFGLNKASRSEATLATEYASAPGSLWSDTDGESNNVVANADSSVGTSDDGHSHKPVYEDLLASPLATPKTIPGTPTLVDNPSGDSIYDSAMPKVPEAPTRNNPTKASELTEPIDAKEPRNVPVLNKAQDDDVRGDEASHAEDIQLTSPANVNPSLESPHSQQESPSVQDKEIKPDLGQSVKEPRKFLENLPETPIHSIPGGLPSVEVHDALESLSASGQRDLPDSSPHKSDNSEIEQLKKELASMESSHKDLQQKLEHQRNVTDQVRQEASLFLEEMRQLTHRSQHSQTADKLAQEASHWQARYEEVRKELDDMRRANRMSRLPSMADYMSVQIEPSVLRDDGEISETAVRNFHDAISLLLSGVRAQPGQWPELLHKVVLATRELGAADKSGNAVSRTANQLITVVRNYAQVKGLMPLAVVDAAAADLTMAVAVTLQELGVFPESGLKHPAVVSKPPAEDIQPPPLSSPKKGLDSRNIPKREPTKLPPVEIPPDSSIAELQGYLEEQTSETVDAISGLLSGIRDNNNAGDLRAEAETIERAAAKMLAATGSSMSQTHNWLLKDKGSFLLETLGDCLNRMQTLNQELWRYQPDTRPNRHLRQRLAGVSFDMAKATKELVKTVEEVSLKQELTHLDSNPVAA